MSANIENEEISNELLKKCVNCQHFNRFYVKGLDKLEETLFGRCYKQHENIYVEYCCSYYKQKTVQELQEIMVDNCMIDIMAKVLEVLEIIKNK